MKHLSLYLMLHSPFYLHLSLYFMAYSPFCHSDHEVGLSDGAISICFLLFDATIPFTKNKRLPLKTKMHAKRDYYFLFAHGQLY